MDASLLSLVVLLASVQGLAAQEENSKVLLRVYYESLCPDSIRFVRDQLMPTWNLLGSQYMQVDFVPFGKAKSEPKAGGGLQFQCQHGPRECLGNMVQACGLSNLLADHDKRVTFVGCAMSSPDPPASGSQCSAMVGLDHTLIEDCLNSSAAEALLYHYEQKTLKLYPNGIPFVPTITINNKFDQDAQNKAQEDLQSVICAYIPAATRPAACL